jgi:hypothetical protein
MYGRLIEEYLVIEEVAGSGVAWPQHAGEDLLDLVEKHDYVSIISCTLIITVVSLYWHLRGAYPCIVASERSSLLHPLFVLLGS